MSNKTVYSCATIDGDFLELREACHSRIIEMIFCDSQSDNEKSMLDLTTEDAVKLGLQLCSYDSELKDLLVANGAI